MDWIVLGLWLVVAAGGMVTISFLEDQKEKAEKREAIYRCTLARVEEEYEQLRDDYIRIHGELWNLRNQHLKQGGNDERVA